MPSHLNMDDFINACQRPLRRSIRVNTLKISVDNFLQLIQQKKWTLEPIPWCKQGFWIERDGCEDENVPLGNTAEHLAGLFYIQEASSMLPVKALEQELANQLSDNPNARLLDMAAAPGSKTTQIAALMQNRGGLVANEYSASRLKVLSANLQRCGVSNAALTHFDARVFGTWLPEQFDAILLDAPCSGEGSVRKDVDAMKNWSLESVQSIADTQKDLIESAFQALKPNGVLVYSTCTLNLQENQQVCQHLQQKYGECLNFEPLNDLFPNAEKAITDDGFLHVYPQIFDSEGFFIAKIRKHQSVPTEPVKKRLGKFPFAPIKQPIFLEQTKQALKQAFSLDIPEPIELWQRDKELWLFPTALTPLIGEVKFSRIGIKLADLVISAKQKDPIFRWTHEAVMSLASDIHTPKPTNTPKASNTSKTDATKPGVPKPDATKTNAWVDLTTQEARDWYKGKDVRPDQPPQKGEVLVSYQGYVIGLGKWVSNRIKNGRPRELVIDKNLF